MEKFVGFRMKTCSYIIDEGSEDKKAKDTKKYVVKRKLKFEIYKNHLEATRLGNKKSYVEKKYEIRIDSLKKITKNS